MSRTVEEFIATARRYPVGVGDALGWNVEEVLHVLEEISRLMHLEASKPG
jgi:hypothetical protein